MTPRLLFLAFVTAASPACKQSSTNGADYEVQSLPGSVIKPRIRPQTAQSMAELTKRLITAANPAGFSASLVKQNIQRSLLSSILSVDGIPRHQIKKALSDLLDPNSAACGGGSCARIFGIKQEDIDDFLDDLRREAEKSPTLSKDDQRKFQNILLASLERPSTAFPSPQKRSYSINGTTFEEIVYASQKDKNGGLRTISVEREVTWSNGAEVKKETLRGYVTYGIRGDVLEVHTLDSAPEGKGSGTVIMKILATEALKLGKSKIHTLSTAQTAQDFYHKIGFRPEKGEVSNMAKVSPDLYQSSLNKARESKGFSSKSVEEREAIVDKEVGRYIATWEAATKAVLEKTNHIKFD